MVRRLSLICVNNSEFWLRILKAGIFILQIWEGALGHFRLRKQVAYGSKPLNLKMCYSAQLQLFGQLKNK